ncbi:hypothetical protein ACH5RR_014269 [Cinchona calisaya]|uniref:Phytocyanin domain-containing protein n=1 Tax=Cinchona calisaya TaxID=153742 RepID=A0ABD3A2F3_9GENT
MDGLTMMLRKRGGALRLLVAVAAAAMLACTVGRLISVGGRLGWQQNVNYTDWASHQHLYMGDWLMFRFDKTMYNVLEVNQTNYEQCNDHEFINNITRGGRDVFQLTKARPYYFLSSGGYCYNGMKVAINVEVYVPAPEPASQNNSPLKTSSRVVLSIVSAIATSIWWHGL